jgi:hypothetical protein
MNIFYERSEDGTVCAYVIKSDGQRGRDIDYPDVLAAIETYFATKLPERRCDGATHDTGGSCPVNDQLQGAVRTLVMHRITRINGAEIVVQTGANHHPRNTSEGGISGKLAFLEKWRLEH